MYLVDLKFLLNMLKLVNFIYLLFRSIGFFLV